MRTAHLIIRWIVLLILVQTDSLLGDEKAQRSRVLSEALEGLRHFVPSSKAQAPEPSIHEVRGLADAVEDLIHHSEYDEVLGLLARLPHDDRGWQGLVMVLSQPYFHIRASDFPFMESLFVLSSRTHWLDDGINYPTTRPPPTLVDTRRYSAMFLAEQVGMDLFADNDESFGTMLEQPDVWFSSYKKKRAAAQILVGDEGTPLPPTQSKPTESAQVTLNQTTPVPETTPDQGEISSPDPDSLRWLLGAAALIAVLFFLWNSKRAR